MEAIVGIAPKPLRAGVRSDRRESLDGGVGCEHLLPAKVRELRRDLDQMLASLKMPRSDDPLFGSKKPGEA